MKILQICAYAAPYEGNFIRSLYALELSLKERGISTIYAFPMGAKDKPWCKEIEKRTDVYYLPVSKAFANPSVYKTLHEIFHIHKDIAVAHSHFEQYDIPVTLSSPSHIKIFWHLHDSIQIGKGIKKLFHIFQYKYVGRRAVLLSVSDFYKERVLKMGVPKENAFTVLNGIDVSRVNLQPLDRKTQYDFITFGWDFNRKGDDLLIDACKLLSNDGYRFKCLINGNESTLKAIQEYCNGNLPEYIIYGPPENDINKLFDGSAVFISASRRETFSYSVCEAAYAGLTVISSDIPGLEWAHEVPSVRFFESEDAVSLARLMRQALENPVSNEDIKQSRKVIQERYSIDCWVNNIIKVFEKKL